MAQQFVTDAGVLIIPGAYSTIKVENSNSGLSTTGVIMLVGEADAGPDFTLEEDLSLNAFGPDQAADVTAKYKSGPIVDGFRDMIAAANDPNIAGTFFRAILVKPNKSLRAANILTKFGGGTYSVIQDRTYGKLGNLIAYVVTAKQSEVVPTTGSTVLTVPQVTTTAKFRVNGGAELSAVLTAGDTPDTMKASIDAVADVAATGGVERTLAAVIVGKSLALVVLSGNSVRVDLTGGTWDTTPSVGDIMVIPAASVIEGAGAENVGSYVVTLASTTQIFATKLRDLTGAGTTLTPPVNDAGGAIAVATADDLRDFSAIIVSLEAGIVVDGLGKSLEIGNNTAGGLLSDMAFTLNTTTLVATLAVWVSKSGAATNLASASEYIANINASRSLDAVTEDLFAGGAVVLTLGYAGTTATATIASKSAAPRTLTLTAVGGANPGTIILTMSDYPTVGDLVTYINSLGGYVAAAANASLAQQATANLDSGVYGIASTWGAKNGRIKQDAHSLFVFIQDSAVLVELPTEPDAGLPNTSALAFLSGGAKGATLAADLTAAIDALESVQGNFLVPCFSRDASLDIADGITDAASTYLIDDLNAYCRTHVLKMSTFKRRRNRQAFLSKQSSFLNNKLAASNIASSRCSMTFQDVKDSNSVGTIVQFQPWMGAVKAAGMQAAGFYRPIVHKFINISGALQKAQDFSDQNDSNLEDALLNGLLPIKRSETGGFFWVSDQTTYTKDDNFVFNSIQATYVADVIALTTARRMENAFVGQSVADVSAQLALTTLESIMADLFRLKLIASSIDAPRGFRNALIRIKGPTMIVSLEVKLAGAIYFVPISFLVTQVQQSAG